MPTKMPSSLESTCVHITPESPASCADDRFYQKHFHIELHAPSITFLYLTTRSWVLASTWPHFTLLGQSLGSLFLAYDAFSLLAPDVFVDTMGYAFALGLSKLLFPRVPTGAYVHYPTISTDMLGSLHTPGQGVNAGQGAGVRGMVKKIYWELFAKLYSWVGSSVDVVVTNSSWTQAHIRSLWGPRRKEKRKPGDVAVLYPPVAVEELEQEVPVTAESETKRGKVILYIAQFRPEKNHKLILNAFAEFMAKKTPATEGAKLVLVGSVRDDSDSKRVYELRLLVNELHIKDRVEFHLDASWPEILEWLRKASVGVNGMWNEHFGIGVVEYMAAGLISVVHNSGGPKVDIVTPFDGQPTGKSFFLPSPSSTSEFTCAWKYSLMMTDVSDIGFHATTSTEFADGFEKALSLEKPLEMRLRARNSAKRFSEEVFAKGWVRSMEMLLSL